MRVVALLENRMRIGERIVAGDEVLTSVSVRSASKSVQRDRPGSPSALPMTAVPTTMPSASKATSARLPLGR